MRKANIFEHRLCFLCGNRVLFAPDPQGYFYIFNGRELGKQMMKLEDKTELFTFFMIYGWQKIAKGFIGRLVLGGMFAGSLVPSARSLQEQTDPDKLVWQVWSPEAQALVVSQGHKVFVDFTAEWCLTCKFNEKRLLETAAFQKLAKDNNVVVMKADYTRGDKAIADFLQARGKPGVPAYFVAGPGEELQDLGSLLTMGLSDRLSYGPSCGPAPHACYRWPRKVLRWRAGRSYGGGL